MPSIASTPRSSLAHTLRDAVALPWNAFVAAFLYYTLLTVVVIGGADLGAGVMAVAYILPPALYAGLLLARAVRAISSIEIDLFHTPHALLR
jgi:hypothetical protein